MRQCGVGWSDSLMPWSVTVTDHRDPPAVDLALDALRRDAESEGLPAPTVEDARAFVRVLQRFVRGASVEHMRDASVLIEAECRRRWMGAYRG